MIAKCRLKPFLLNTFQAQKIPATNEKESEFLSTLVKEINDMEGEDEKLNHITDPDVLEQIRKIYVKSIGFKK